MHQPDGLSIDCCGRVSCCTEIASVSVVFPGGGDREQGAVSLFTEMDSGEGGLRACEIVIRGHVSDFCFRERSSLMRVTFRGHGCCERIREEAFVAGL